MTEAAASRFARLSRRLRAMRDDELVRKLARGGIQSVLIKSGGAALSLVMMVALARVMDPEDYGRFGFGFSVAMFASVVAGLGLQLGIMRWRPEHEVQGAPHLALAAERWAGNLTLAAASVAAASIAAGGWAASALAPSLGLPTPDAFSPQVAAAAGSFTIPLAASAFTAAALRARGSTVAALAPRDLAWRTALSAAAFWLASRGARIDAAEALLLCAALLALATLGQYALTGVRPGPAPGAAGDLPALSLSGPAWSWMRQATPMWLSSVMTAMQRHFEVVLVGLFLAPAVTGLYFAAVSSAQVIGLMLLAGNMVAGPLVARTYHAGDIAGLQRLLRLVMLGVTGPTLAALALLWVFGDFVLSLFDPSYAGQGALLALLACGTAAMTLTGPAALVLMLASAERAQMRIVSRVVPLMALSQAAAIPLFGAWGAAALNVTGAIVLGVWSRGACLRLIGVDPTVLCLLRRPAAANGHAG